MSVAEAFPQYLNTVILDGIGGKNTETHTATTYVAFVTDEAAPVLDKVRTFVNNNWESAKVFPNCTKDEDKLARVPQLIVDNLEKFEAPPKVAVPLKQAVQNIIVRMFPDAFAGKTGSVLTKIAAPEVERFLLTANLEKFRPQIEAELISIASAQGKRGRKGAGGEGDAPLNLAFDTAEPVAAE